MPEKVGCRILVRGIVQGVGFRPLVYGYAQEANLTGWVCNSTQGVEIEVFGAQSQIDNFIDHLRNAPPPLARIDHFDTQSIPYSLYSEFRIVESQTDETGFLPISPDIAICPDCQEELFDPANRRYRYPFINCTNCGPRFTIIKKIPYDRLNTTMAEFNMCPDCKAEYDNPTDRRFHAQPIACPECGPQVAFEIKDKDTANGEAAIQTARKMIKDGGIVALKGLGGYLLACDAYNHQAVAELRRRKIRSQKPFALMANDLPTIREHCSVSSPESTLLKSVQHPIVLLAKKEKGELSESIAPGQKTLGFMLPYTPLHLLLMEPEDGYPDVLVMTSGNISEEPIYYEDGDAHDHLGDIADAFLVNNRRIHMRTDDSVVSIVNGAPYFSRRARGYAPNSVQLPQSVPAILATGAELKNSFCLARDEYAFPSHHIGDLQNYETLESFESGIKHFEGLFRIQPELIACDLHPDYLSTQYARDRSCKMNTPLIPVQHHHAHMAACLADNHWSSDQPAIGMCFDGTGYGSDQAIWGGEILVGGYKNYQRAYHLDYMPLPGGDTSIHKPYRTALAYFWKIGIAWNEIPDLVKGLSKEEISVLEHQLPNGINIVNTSSMGRLFDSVSALLGVCRTSTYEGQAAIELETVADPNEDDFYDFSLMGDVIMVDNILISIIKDLHKGISQKTISGRFHNTISQMVLKASQDLKKSHLTDVIVLSGGVWQNRLLLEKTLILLEKHHFHTLIHRQVPTNDGGISLGQVMVAAHNDPR